MAHRKMKAYNKNKVRSVTVARREERGKVKELKQTMAKAQKAFRQKLITESRQKLAAAKETQAAQVEARLEGEYEERSQQQRKGLNTARNRAREAEKETGKAQRKLQRVEKAAAKAAEAREAEAADDGSDESDVEPRKLPFDVMPRRDDNGRFQAEADEVLALRWAQLARAVAPSTISANISDVLALFAPEADIAQNCDAQNNILRGEVTLAGEAMAAFKFAKAVRILFCGWDESTKFGDAVFSINFTVEYADGTREDVCLRGLSILPSGGTSAALLEHIETRIFSYSRRLLTLWMETYEKDNGAGSWAAAGGPSPENIGLHRLCEDTVLMTDTCNGARCTKRLLAAAIMKTIEEKVGTEAWEAMSPKQRNQKYKVFRADCWQHLRNIMIDAMAEAGNAHVKAVPAVADSLDLFSSYERIDVNGSSVIIGACKQFHHGGEYCKGRCREFTVWRKLGHKQVIFIPFERAVGNRQDLKFDGCISLFWNRIVCLEFLRGYIDSPKSENVLDKSLYTLLRCNEFVALLRANSLWKLIYSEPFRWLAGKTSKLKDWSLYKMSEVLDLVEKAMKEIVADPQRALDPNLDIFKPIAEQISEFKEWQAEHLATKVKAEDGTEHELFKEVLRECRTPTPGSGNDQATPMCLEIIKAQAKRALEKMHDERLALSDKLTSQNGVNSIGRNADAHERTKGIHGTNDTVENKFASADYVMRTYRGISILNASGIVQQRTAHDFDRPINVMSDRRKRKTPFDNRLQKEGFFWTLIGGLRGALVKMVRRELPNARKTGCDEKQAHDEEKLSRREEALQRQLNATVLKYAAALELYDQWKAQGVKDKKELTAALQGKSVNDQLAELRRQIEMRTVGLGWHEFDTKWGFLADEKQQTIDNFKCMLLEDILPVLIGGLNA